MNKETIQSAEMLIAHSEAACGHKCKLTPRRVVQRLQTILSMYCNDASYDVEDAISDVYVEFVIKKQFRRFTETLMKVLENQGRIDKTEDGDWESTAPTMEELWGVSNDDDLQGEEITYNDMHQVASVEMGPASDAHIASIDIGEVFGQESREIFECLLAGEKELPIADLTGLSRDQVKRRRRNIEDFLGRHEYTLAPVNNRLGAVLYFHGQKYSFPAEKQTQKLIRADGGHNKNTWVDHRSTSYVDRPLPDLYNPIRPAGDEISNEGLGYEMNLGIEHFHLYV